MVHLRFQTKVMPNGGERMFTRNFDFMCKDEQAAFKLIESLKESCCTKIKFAEIYHNMFQQDIPMEH